MQKAIIGKKLGMTQLFTEEGRLIPITVIEAGPNKVIQKKEMETDGYTAVQVGFIDLVERKVNKPRKGHFDKNKAPYKKVLKEFRLEKCGDLSVGDDILCNVFAQGERVDVSGISKGHGFSGTVKRWGTHRGPMSHGSGYHRGVGSMGACSFPGKVMKGKKLPGHFGVDRVTVQNLDIVKVDEEKNLILLRGAVPGVKGGIVVIKNTVKSAKK